jgi:hypothetical protein
MTTSEQEGMVMSVGNPWQWISATFSAEASEDDLVKARSLNTTRVAAVVAPVLTGIVTVVGDLKDKPPFDDVGFQKQVILALIGLIALVSAADILSRSLATARAASAAAASTVLPGGVKAEKDDGRNNTKIVGTVVAFRTSNADSASEDGDYLFVTDQGVASWEKGSELAGVGT